MRSKLWKLGMPCLVSVTLLSLIVACAPPPKQVEEAVSFPMEVTDQLGRVVKLEKIPERIISLTPSNTEILFALDLENRVVGVTTFCNYPQEAKSKPKIGGFSTVDIEKVISLAPDLVLAHTFHKKTVIPTLENLGITVVALSAKSLTESIDNILFVGEITDREREARKLTNKLEGRIKTITDATKDLPPYKKPKVLFLGWHDPPMTDGSGTLVDDIITKAGGINVFSDLSGYKAIDLETIIHRNPEVILVFFKGWTEEDKHWLYEFVLNEPRLKVTKAVSTGRVYEINDQILVPTPRGVDALEQAARHLHPELFQK